MAGSRAKTFMHIRKINFDSGQAISGPGVLCVLVVQTLFADPVLHRRHLDGPFPIPKPAPCFSRTIAFHERPPVYFLSLASVLPIEKYPHWVPPSPLPSSSSVDLATPIPVAFMRTLSRISIV